MLRMILGVILGYVAMFLGVFLMFSLAYMVLGAEGAFKPQTYAVSTTWIIVSLVLGLVAAAIGGCVCVAIARSMMAARALAILVLALGLIMAIPVLRDSTDPDSTPRPPNVGNTEAMQSARQPGWVALLNPFVGALGVLTGARLRRPTA